MIPRRSSAFEIPPAIPTRDPVGPREPSQVASRSRRPLREPSQSLRPPLEPSQASSQSCRNVAFACIMAR
ncbi:hypothetical protein L484_023606 [Morus notabilis]|uniref:Uncharacterized protein n=1 Tax=Morus notabilis TaxID=981085 RepID=W9RGG1_9ROSA|nr:hypothetical protein L484_023606 [Morus notabilis]